MEKTEARSGWRQLAAASRPLAALTAVWLTTSGHTSNFRELNAAHGWISSEGYSLHSAYLFSIALILLPAPWISRHLGNYATAVIGLTVLAGASLANGLLLNVPWSFFILGRVSAGTGAGLVIFAAPKLIDPSWARQAAWAAVLLPPLGPPVIAAASILYGWSSWEGGFLFEGLLALFGLALLVSMKPPPEPSQEGIPAPLFLPALALGTACLWYLLHWGQLSGWLESGHVWLALAFGVVGYTAVVVISWPRLERGVVLSTVPRLILVGYAGFAQYFNVSDMGVYGGLLVNFSAWQRSMLVWSLSLGAASALALGEFLWRGRPPRLSGALFGLLVLAGGMALARRTTLSWPFWSVLNTWEFNWFPAPQFWELAPARFMMGFGSALVLFSGMTNASPAPAVEIRIRPRLLEAQFVGGAISIGVLATALLAGHQLEYAYATDRGFIQAQEVAERTDILTTALTDAGQPLARRQAELLMYRAVNYQADNLLFADIYAGFLITSLGLAALVLVGMFVRRK